MIALVFFVIFFKMFSVDIFQFSVEVISTNLGLASTYFIFFSGTRIPPLILMTQMYGGIDSFALLALPMFVLT